MKWVKRYHSSHKMAPSVFAEQVDRRDQCFVFLFLLLFLFLSSGKGEEHAANVTTSFNDKNATAHEMMIMDSKRFYI